MALTPIFALVITGLTIAGVYYDPIQAESGGEAIQLHNDGSAPVSLDSISLATKQTSYPLPSATLLPGSGYLVADTGWSGSRDNSSWPDADLELGLSLANTDGFVQLVQGNATLDNLSWNGSFKAREGRMLTHAGEEEPFFFNSSSTLTELSAQVVVLDGAPLITNVTITDDAPEAGIQLLSYNRTVHVSASVTDSNGEPLAVTVEFFGQEYEMQGSGRYSVIIPFSGAAPGEYTITIRASGAGSSAEERRKVSVLSSVSVGASGQLVFSGTPGALAHGNLTVHNDGNIEKQVTLLLLLPEASCGNGSVRVAPGERITIGCTATIPAAAAGNYTYPVRLLAS